MQQKCQIIGQLTKKTWRNILINPFEEEKIGKLLDKKIARTARRQLDGRHLLFGEYYFAVLNNPLSLKLADIFPRERFNELRLLCSSW